MEVIERLELRGDEDGARRRLRHRPGHRGCWLERLPRGQRDRGRRLEAMVAKARERLGDVDADPSPICPSSSSSEPVDARLLERRPSTGSPTTSASSSACTRRCGRAGAWAPSAAERATSPALRAAIAEVAAAPRLRDALRGLSTGLELRRPGGDRSAAERGRLRATSRCWLQPRTPSAAGARALHPRPSASAPQLDALPEELAEPFVDDVARWREPTSRWCSTTCASTSSAPAARLDCRPMSDAPRIVLLPGDGIGPEIVAAAAAARRSSATSSSTST